MAKRYLITRTEDERAHLLALTKKGKVSARKLTRAHLLLQADAGGMDAAHAAALHVGIATVERVRKRCVEEGLDAALGERPRPGGPRQLDGQQEAYLIALACRTPPAGRTSWTGPFRADTLVERWVVDTIADDTVRRTLTKTPARRGRKRPGIFRA
jgi:putative transposase